MKGGHNHANYVDKRGRYCIVKYINDHQDMFPSIGSVGIGQLCPHITTEVDCESLFSQAGHLSNPRRARTGICMYERLVVGKHRMHHIHCHIPKVKKLFLDRWKAKSWTEKEERDDKEFLELEKELYAEQFSHAGQQFLDEIDNDNGEEEQTEEGDNDDSSVEEEVTYIGKKKTGKKRSKVSFDEYSV